MSHPHIPACSLQDRLKWTIREASALAVNDGLTDPPPQAKRVARRSRSLSGKWHGPETSVFFVGLGARSAAMPCAPQATSDDGPAKDTDVPAGCTRTGRCRVASP